MMIHVPSCACAAIAAVLFSITPAETLPACHGLIIENPDLRGEQTNDHFGATFASGDWNADGFDDLAIGSYTHPGTPNTLGEVWLFLGDATGGLQSEPTLTVKGTGESDLLGVAITFLDDFTLVEGQPADALVIGAPDWRDPAEPNPTWDDLVGRVYVFHGREEGVGYASVVDADQAADVILHGGVSAAGWFGGALTSLDFDEDGRGDLVVGEPGTPDSDNLGDATPGRIFGYTAETLDDAAQGGVPWPGSTADFSLPGRSSKDRFGRSLAVLDDVDSSPSVTQPALVAGAPQLASLQPTSSSTGSGYVRVLTIDWGATPALALHKHLRGTQFGEGMGWSVANVPSTDGDDSSELAIGCLRYSSTADLKEGRVLVYATPSYSLLATFVGEPSIVGDPPTVIAGGFGCSLAGVANLVGTPGGDLIVGAGWTIGTTGACTTEGQNMAGSAYVIDLSPGANPLVPLEVEGEEFKDHVGFGVHVMDLIGDGTPDLVTGGLAWSPSRGETEVGRVYVVDVAAEVGP